MTRPARLLLPCILLFSLLVPAPFLRAQGPNDPCSVGDAAILATNSVRLARDVVVHSGDVVVNDFSPGPTLGPGGFELYVDRRATVAGSLKADSIRIIGQASIGGDVFYNDLTNSGSISGAQISPLALPVFDPLPTFSPPSPPRGPVSDVNVGIGQTLTLGPGDYGDIRVDALGTIVFSGGVYNVRSIDLFADAGTLTFQAASEVRIEDKFRTRRLAFIGPAAGSGIAASDVVFYVAGINGATGALNDAPEAARIGADSTASANFYVPNGTLRLEESTVNTGAFLGRDVDVDSRAQVSRASAFGNEPPTANPQSVTTGAASVVITLSGSDPEGQDLAFAIAAGPSAGTLSAITPNVPDPIEDPENPGTFIQPPITQATVTYTADVPGDPDSFTFSVTDGCGKIGMAAVTLNPVDPSPPDPGLAAVDATDVSVETVGGTPVTVTLPAGAPAGDTLSFSIESQPANGSLGSLTGNQVTYTPSSGFTGSDSFVFRATGSPSGTTDTATAFITVGERPRLAEDRQVETPLNQPVVVTLVGNPGGTGDENPVTSAPLADRSLKPRAFPGAAIAGNVSDADGNGLGDGRDNLPGPAPVLVAAGVDVNLGATPTGSVTDPAGDATNVTSDDPANPDLVSATVASDGANLNFAIRFVASGFSATTSRGSFVLDTDENPATGFPGVDAANNDSALMGIEFLVNIGADLGASAEVLKFIAPPNSFSTVGSFPATVVSNGYDVSIPLTAFDDDDGRLTFKAETQSFLGPGFTGILDYMPDLGLAPGQARTGVQGVARIQIEWDIQSLPASADGIESATVTLSTQKGTVDDLDTFFFAGDADQDGLLRESDFQAPASAIPGVVMPVPFGPAGTEGSFAFDVTAAVKAAVARGDDFFSVQGRVNEDLAGGGFRRGLQVRSTADGNLAAGTEPKLEVITAAPPLSNLSITVLSLPQFGTLTLAGTPVTAGQTFVNTNLVSLLYTPPLGFSGSTSFSYRVTEGIVSAIGDIGIFIDPNDGCVEVGRPPGCAPPGN